MSEFVGAAAFVALITCIIIMTPDRTETLCVDRDMPATERIFLSCITAQSGHNINAAYDCRKEAERLACKSWSRP